MNKWLRAFVGVSIIFLLVYIFDYKEIVNAFRNIDIRFVFLVGLVIMGSTLFGAIGMYLLVSRGNEILFSRFLPVYWASWAIGLVVPGQVGDVASISLLLKRLGFEWSVILARSLVDKVITLFIMLALAIYGLIFFAKVDQINSKAILWIIFWLVLVSTLFIWVQRRFVKKINSKKSKILRFISRTLKEIVDTVLNYPFRVIANILITFFKITLIGSAYWFMFKALGHADISLWEVIPLVAASSLIAYLPISLNGVGTVEITGILLFSYIGLPETMVLTTFLSMRLIVFLLAWLPASLILLIAREPASNTLS